MVKKAFTLIEVIVCITILSIVLLIYFDIIAVMFKSYNKSYLASELEQKSQIAIDQISKMLQFRIKDTVLLNSITPNKQKEQVLLEWLGYEYDSFRGMWRENIIYSSWSGIIDIDSNQTSKVEKTLKTPNSNLKHADEIISSLFNKEVSLSGYNKYPVLIFKESMINPIAKGWVEKSNEYFIQVACKEHKCSKNKDVFEIIGDSPKIITEHYYLVGSAYALSIKGDKNDFNMTLHSNYQPWINETYKNSKYNSTLTEHVSKISITQEQYLLTIRICFSKAIDKQKIEKIEVCKEKLII